MHADRLHRVRRGGLACAVTIAQALIVMAVWAPIVRAQQPGASGGSGLQAEPSGRARTTVMLRRAPNTPPLKLEIDYGQPHARGRQVLGGVVPYDRVWRTGANAATSLVTEVDLTLGGVRVPRGSYTLYSLPTRTGWKLIVNKQTGQWGTDYDASRDLARIDMRARTLREPAESFTITLVPSGNGRGTLRLAWGTTELSTDWVAR